MAHAGRLQIARASRRDEVVVGESIFGGDFMRPGIYAPIMRGLPLSHFRIKLQPLIEDGSQRFQACKRAQRPCALEDRTRKTMKAPRLYSPPHLALRTSMVNDGLRGPATTWLFHGP